MLRDENLLFGLYAMRVGLLSREQFISITKSLKSGEDVDLGKSLAKRHVIDGMQAKAIWELVGVQSAMLGDARKAMGSVPMDDETRQALHASIIAADMPATRPSDDEGTINIESPIEGT